MRYRGDEAKLTQVIAEIARVDADFSRGFVELVLDTAERDAHAANVKLLRREPLPPSIGCRAEQHLRDTEDISLGRVDLRFDGEGFTLFVENKLYSGYGEEQVPRYLRALKRLPPEGRAALVAVTRSVPTHGEPTLDADPRWLGSVRWSKMLDGLRSLPINDRRLRTQWRLFLDVLHEQGDLGMTTANAELIRAWARYREGRDHLEALLDQVWPRALDVVQRELKKTYPRRGKRAELADIYRKGKKGQVVVQRDQNHVYLAFRAPAIVKDPALYVQFSAVYGVPHFTVQADPWESQWRLDNDDPQLARASERLRAEGFQTNGTYWAMVHDPEEYLDAKDVPAKLMELIERDVRLIVKSRILDHDIDLGVNRRRGGPPRHRRLPAST